MLLGAFIVLILSTSTSAYLASAFFLCAFAAANYRRVITSNVKTHIAWILAGGLTLLPIACAALVVAYQAIPDVTAYFDRMLFNKLSSDSGVERMSWNRQAFQNFTDTWMIGAGLGSVRASNWLVACLASLGAVGTFLFLAVLYSLARAPVPEDWRETAIVIRSLKSGCLALLLGALITTPTPNLGIAFFAMAGAITGLSAGAARLGQASRQRLRSAPGGGATFQEWVERK
nr:O-antigen ligase family protein [Mangrovicoccus sp. HB161399]